MSTFRFWLKYHQSEVKKQLWLLENIWLMVTQNKKAVTEIMYPIVIFVYV